MSSIGRTVEVKSGSAITVINAIKSPFGAAIGTSLLTTVQITRSDSLKFSVPKDIGSTALLESCLKHYSTRWEVNTDNLHIKTQLVQYLKVT